MNFKKKVFIFIISLFIFVILVFAKNSVLLSIKKDGNLSVGTNIEGKITSAMIDNLKSGIEASIKYTFSLYKRNYTLGISTFSLIDSTEYEFNLRWDNLNNTFVIYNKENNYEFESLAKLEKFIFNHKFENIFKLNSKGKYFIKLDFSFETLKLVPPFSFILIFVNIYNIKINDIQSNNVEYEVSPEHK